MTPETHDAAFAAVSHLPHLIAFALIQRASPRQPAGQRLPGARRPRLSRLHAHRRQRPEVWRDILLANRDELLEQSQAFQRTLDAMEHVIETGNGEALEGLIAQASDARADWRMGHEVAHRR